IRKAAAIDDQRMIEQTSVAIRRGLEPLQEVSKQLGVKTVDLGDLLNPVRIATMMRERMMRIRNTDLRIYPHAAFSPQHQSRDASQVRLKGHDLQIEHQLRIIGESNRYTRWFLQRWRRRLIVFLRELNPLFDLANCG